MPGPRPITIRLAEKLRPEGLHIDHLCGNRTCCKPEHLEAVTQAENNRRANALRWLPGGYSQAKEGGAA